jgi:hypothetical protein
MENKMNKRNQVVHWLPRIICILAILFISIFAADAFEQGLSAVLIHLIPSFVLLTFLIVAWKWEFIGGIIFTLIGLGFTPVIFMLNYNRNHSIWLSLFIILVITFPFIIVGILFIVSHLLKRKNLQSGQI